MKYDDPRLRELLAGEYVLGVMPLLVKARFERLLASDPALAREVAAWADRFSPVDTTVEAMAPPAHVWRAIERQIGAPAVRRTRSITIDNILSSLGLWRGLTAVSTLLAAALLVFVVLRPSQITALTVVAVLTDSSGTPAFIVTRNERSDQIEVAPIRTQALAAQRSFELWAIAGGTPKPLGLVPPELGARLQVPAAQVGSGDIVLAISLEPEHGSPQAGPTGPVLFQGKVLAALR